MRAKMAVVWVVVIMACAAVGRAEEATTMAVVVDGGTDAQLSNLASVLEAQLSENKRIRLLERTGVRRLLEEQRLSLAGLAQRDGAIKAGQLLRVRAFVLLSTESLPRTDRGPNSVLVRVRVAETAHGLRLWEGYEPSDGPQTETVARRVAQRVAAVVDKLALPAGQIVPAGIIDIHRVQLGESYDLLTRALPRLLSARLSTEPRLVVLERENLGLLLKEKQLTQGEDTAFWDSGILIDGVLRPAAGGGLEMALRWRRVGQEGAIAAPVDPNAPARAAEAAAAILLQAAMETSTLARWEPEKEADEFFRQGELLRAHRRQENAFGPLEAAYALQPEKLPYIGALFENEWELRGYMFANGLISPTGISHYSDEQLAELVSQLVRGVRRGWETGALSSRDFCDQWGTPFWIRSGRWSYFVRRASVSSEVVRGMNRANRRIWFEVVDQALKTQPVNERFPVWNFSGRAALPWLSSDDPKEVMDNVRKIYGEIMFPPAQGGTVGSSNLRCSVCEKSLLARGSDLSISALRESQFCGSETQLRALWFAYLDELSRCEDPFVRFCAYAARADALSCDADPPSQSTLPFWWKAQKVLTDELHGPASPLTDLVKLHLCVSLKEILVRALGNDPSRLVATWESVYKPLIDGKNARALTWWDPGYKCGPVEAGKLPTGTAQRFRDLLARMETVLETDKNEKLTSEVLGRVRDCRAALESQYGLSTPGTGRSRREVIMLLTRRERSVSRPALYYEAQWQLGGTMLYVAMAGESGRLALACVDLTGRTPGRLVQAKVAAHWNTLAGFVATEEAAYVAVRGSGVAVLPSGVWNGRDTGSNVKILTERHGLPSVSLTGMAGDQEQLWLAYGRPDAESGLGRYDLKTGRWETILCSTLQGEEPFNAGRPYGLRCLVRPSSDSLFFINCGRMFRGMVPWMGLWRLNTATKSLKYYGYCGTEEGFMGSLDAAGEDCWCRGSDCLIRLDTQSEEATYILGAQWRPSDRRAAGTTHWLDCRNDLFLPEAAMKAVSFGTPDRGGLDLATCAIHGDDLWALLGEAQIAVLHRGKPFTEAQILQNDILEGEAVRRFVSTPYGLVAIGDGVIGLVQTEGRAGL